MLKEGIDQGSRRATLHPQIAELRGQGLMWREIAERLGLAISTVESYYSDPTGERVRERKMKNARPCLGCGKLVNTDGRIAEPALRCVDCASVHARKWTKEGMIEACREWARRFGSKPAATNWNVAADGCDVARWNSGDWPHTATVMVRFGSWNAFIEAAGFTPTPPHAKKSRLSPEDFAETREMFDAGLSLTEMAERLEITPQGVEFRLRRMGLRRQRATRRTIMTAPLRAENVLDREIERIEGRAEKIRAELAEADETIERLKEAKGILAGHTNGAKAA